MKLAHAFVLAMSFGVALGEGQAQPAGAPCEASPTPAFAQEALDRINQFRASKRSCGRRGSFAPARALTWNGWLAQAADAHSRDMAQRNYFSHDSRDGRNLKDRVEAAGYAWRALGENIAAGAPTVPVVMAGWQRSDEHCANLMNPEFTEVGLACMPSPAGAAYKTYWTMDFGRPRRGKAD